jgi:hypothetical protein
MMDMEDLESKPHGMPPLSLLTNEQKIKWVDSVSAKILENLQVNGDEALEKLHQDLLVLNTEDQQVQQLKMGDIYHCPQCNKTYKVDTWLRKHLTKTHKWKFHSDSSLEESTQCSPVSKFLFLSLIYRDTCNAYKMGDGDRIVRNAYFEWLIDSSLGHTKYKLWLWRMISYCISILGIERSFEYKWNMCINLKGGISSNIPNDNGVELQVKQIKAILNTQGVNKSFESAKRVCMTTQVINDMSDNLIKETKSVKSKRSRPPVDKSKDIMIMAKCLRNQGSVKDMEWKSFKNFKDPLQKINAVSLHEWIKKQKMIANLYL